MATISKLNVILQLHSKTEIHSNSQTEKKYINKQIHLPSGEVW